MEVEVEVEDLTGERLPIMRKAVRVESKRKAILLVGAAGMLRLLTLAVSAAGRSKKKNHIKQVHDGPLVKCGKCSHDSSDE